jgi:hypothetical protein
MISGHIDTGGGAEASTFGAFGAGGAFIFGTGGGTSFGAGGGAAPGILGTDGEPNLPAPALAAGAFPPSDSSGSDILGREMICV